MTNRQYRQGDVLLVQIDSLPNKLKPVPLDQARVILAYGEVTGHAHAIEALQAVLYQKDDKRYLSVPIGAVLRHEEHAELPIAAGTYEVIRQREYEHNGWRRVAD